MDMSGSIDDEVVREIPVYISSNDDSNSTYLLQWPLAHANIGQQHAMFRGRNGNRNSNKDKNTMVMVPENARLRPKHDMLELDYSFAASNSHSNTVYESNLIQPQTHMAIGRWSVDGSSIHLTPLSKTIQVRPSFKHFNEQFVQDFSDMNDNAMIGDSAAPKPLMFKKKESEKAIAARKSSYAYKRRSEESEEWIELDVHDTSSELFHEKRDAYLCSREDMLRDLKLRQPQQKHGRHGDQIGLSPREAYMNSLCYLPTMQTPSMDLLEQDPKLPAIVSSNGIQM